MNNNFFSFLIYLISIFFICFFVLIISYFLGNKSYKNCTQIPFESGIDSVGNSRLRFSVKFYLIAMFFVIFDVEAMYIYSWASVVREVGYYGFFNITIFIITLLISLFYLIKMNIFYKI